METEYVDENYNKDRLERLKRLSWQWVSNASRIMDKISARMVPERIWKGAWCREEWNRVGFNRGWWMGFNDNYDMIYLFKKSWTTSI